MKKTFKGFTLVECLVAMAILAIASTLMAEIYAAVSQRNTFNHFMNTSLSNQMAYVEQYIDAKTVPIYYGNTADTPDPQAATSSTTKLPPHKKSTTTNYNYVKVTKLGKDASGKDAPVADSTYSFPVDVYVMYSRDTSNVGGNNKDENDHTASYSQRFSEKDNNLRYKYLLGH